MDELEMMELDRKVARAAELDRRWVRGLAAGLALDDEPFAAVPEISRDKFLELAERPADDPLKAPLSSWFVRLLDDKANRAVKVAFAFERVVRRHPLDAPERCHVSLSQMSKRALAEPERRHVWLEQLVERSHDARDAQVLYWERRQEVARRLGLASPDDFELPCPDVVADAEWFLSLTDDLASEFRSDDLARLLGASLGLEAVWGWPSRITPGNLLAPFRESRLLESLELDPGRLVAPIAAASHLRAYARLGAAFVDAIAPTNQPFCVRHDAFGLRRRTHGALFGLLPLSREFAKRTLDLSQRVGDHQRVVARVVLLAARAAAFRVLLRPPALAGRAAFLEAHTGLGERVFGVPLPPSTAGALFQLHPDDGQRFAGILLARSLDERLIEAHDEDWYRNPRAGEELRSNAALVPSTKTTSEELRAGAKALKETLARALG
jgi:hypothetical protein